MTFPQTPLDTAVEIFVNDAWEDITDYVFVGDGIEIHYGQSDEASETEPASCSFTLNNRDGRFSPRNPVGPYYGSIGRNTPARVKVDLGSPRFVRSGASASAECPDAAGLGVTGDLDLRYFGYAADWGVGSSILMRKANVVDDSSWSFETSETFGLILYWWDASETLQSAWTDLPSVQRAGAQCLRVTLDVDNGAGGYTVTFYCGPTIDGPWDQVGAPVVGGSTTSVFDSAQKIFINALDVYDEIFAVQVRDGIGGTAVADPDFTLQTPGTTSFADAAGNTWSVVGSGASITDEHTRFFGEVSSWPMEWDVSQVDVRAKVAASGPLRRLAQGEPIQSAYLRAVTGRAADLLAYWPMEDGESATSFGAGLETNDAGSWSGEVSPGAFSGFACSEPVATIGDGGVVTLVPPASALTAFSVRALIAVPEGGIAASGSLLRVETTGTLGALDLLYLEGGGDLNVLAYDSDGALLDTTGIVDFNVDGTAKLYELEAWQNGSDVQFSLVLLAPGGAPSQGSGTVTLTGQTLTGVTRVTLNDGAFLSGYSIGHLTIQTSNPTPAIRELDDALGAYAGELAGARYDRLLVEQNVSGVSSSGLDTEPVGAQKRATFLALIQEAARADDAILAERRHDGSLLLRSRFSMYDQYPALTLPYERLQRLGPVDDDLAVHNDVTVTRIDGASARATSETGGALSVDVIGRYAAQDDLSLETDIQTVNQAYWRLARGTVDESRYPGIEFNLAAPEIATDPDLLRAILALSPGDLFVVEGPPSFAGSPDDVVQIVLGVTETFDQFSYVISVNCTPAFPFQSTRLNDDETRAGASDSALDGALDSTSTSFDVNFGAGAEWVNSTDDASAFPFDIVVGGERMTVSAITAPTGTVQTFTVTRSVNGVVKSHADGATVQVADVLRLAL